MILSVENALTRLERIDWSHDGYENRVTNAFLMREYLRRSALWCRLLQIQRVSPFFDVVAHLDEKVQIPDKYVDRFESALPKFLMPVMAQTCRWYIRWVVWKASGRNTQENLPDFYEPLLKFYERGGYVIINAGGGIDIDAGLTLLYSGWPKGKFEDMEPLDISDERLSRIDEENRMK